MQRPLCLLLLCSIVGPVSAESRWVDVMREMRDASVVEVVRVVGYDHARLHCVTIDRHRPLSLKCSPDGTWVPGPEAIEPDLKRIGTAQWPGPGSQVLVIADRASVVSLFACPSRLDWRFWSPWSTGSEASFRYDFPLRPLQKTLPDKGCPGGCLLSQAEARLHMTAQASTLTLTNRSGRDIEYQTAGHTTDKDARWILVPADSSTDFVASPGDFLSVRYPAVPHSMSGAVSSNMQIYKQTSITIVDDPHAGVAMPTFR